MQRLSELFNVNIFLVSQTNPWVIPFLDQDDGFEVFNYEKKLSELISFQSGKMTTSS